MAAFNSYLSLEHDYYSALNRMFGSLGGHPAEIRRPSFGKIRVLAKSRNRCKFIQVLLQCIGFTFLYFSKKVTSLVIGAKDSISFKLQW